MKHRTAKFIDFKILKPLNLASPFFILYGLYDKIWGTGTWSYILIGIVFFFVPSMIGQALYPKSTPDDLVSGGAWGDTSPDNEQLIESIDINMPNIKTKLDTNH